MYKSSFFMYKSSFSSLSSPTFVTCRQILNHPGISHLIKYVLCLVAQLCPTLCDSMDCSPPGSSVHGVLQARILEWVVMAFSRDLPNPGIEPRSPTLQADSLPIEPPGKPSQSPLFSYHWSVCECKKYRQNLWQGHIIL